jgi:hypothetical protein
LSAAWRQWGWLSLPRLFSFLDWSATMAIYRFLQNSAFAPEDIAPLVAAYEDCLRSLKLSDRSDPISEMVAKKIIEIAQTGIRDSGQLGRLALREIGVAGSE